MRLRRALRVLKDVLYGMFLYEMVLVNRRAAKRIDQLIFLVTLGDVLGVPILPPYYSLRLFPHFSKDLAAWKRYVVRERDFTDLH